jgi:hypothetical protein
MSTSIVADLVKALEPFRLAADAAERNLHDEAGPIEDARWTTPNLFSPDGTITYDDLRRARTALARAKEALHETL